MKSSDQPIDIPKTVDPLPPHASIPCAQPIAKVTNPAWCSLAATVLAFVASKYFKIEIPADVALAGMGLLALIVGYFTPLKQREVNQ